MNEPRTILVVEDNLLNMELLLEMLKVIGKWKFLKAYDGNTALKLLEHNTPKVILLDIQLPNINGFEVLKRIKNNASTAEIPVIGVTAHAMKGDKEKILSAGFDAYISKPVTIKKLQNTLKEVLN